MFNIFRKKRIKSMQEWEYGLLKSVIAQLPKKYSFLNNQINKEFILDSVPNEFLEKGWKRVICDQNLYNSFKKLNINYKIVGIKIFDLATSSYKDIELDLYEGVLIGYKIEENLKQFDGNNINIENLKEIKFENRDKEELNKILGEVSAAILSQLDIDDTFKIELKEGEFYVIKDLNDGNYLAVNKSGAVFGMIHDPYEVEKLFNDKESFFNALDSGKFIISEYLNKKML